MRQKTPCSWKRMRRWRVALTPLFAKAKAPIRIKKMMRGRCQRQEGKTRAARTTEALREAYRSSSILCCAAWRGDHLVHG